MKRFEAVDAVEKTIFSSGFMDWSNDCSEAVLFQVIQVALRTSVSVTKIFWH